MNCGAKTEYIYLLQEREFIKTKENIYKIGMTRKKNFERFNQYPNGSVLLFQMMCDDCKMCETKILNIFKNKFNREKNVGNEFFSGDYNEMIDVIYTVIKNENYTCKNIRANNDKNINEELNSNETDDMYNIVNHSKSDSHYNDYVNDINDSNDYNINGDDYSDNDDSNNSSVDYDKCDEGNKINDFIRKIDISDRGLAKMCYEMRKYDIICGFKKNKKIFMHKKSDKWKNTNNDVEIRDLYNDLYRTINRYKEGKLSKNNNEKINKINEKLGNRHSINKSMDFLADLCFVENIENIEYLQRDNKIINIINEFIEISDNKKDYIKINELFKKTKNCIDINYTDFMNIFKHNTFYKDYFISRVRFKEKFIRSGLLGYRFKK